MRTIGVLCLGLLLGMGQMAAQSAAAKSEVEIRGEDQQAQAFVDKQNLLAALPLYEDLHKQQPQNVRFTERLAVCLLAEAGQQSDAKGKATRERAKQLLLQAKAGGDNSGLVQVLLEKLQSGGGSGEAATEPAGHEFLAQGEKAFTGGDLQAAVKFYSKAYEVNPQYYAAALFAGDAEYKSNHPAEAGAWFAKATAIDPDTETAHRYWGDCLDKAGDHQRAEEQFIQAIVAAPYSRAPRVGLKQWADANQRTIVPPPIKLPGGTVTEGKDGHINITVPAPSGDKKDDPEAGAAMAYSLGAAVWHTSRFKKEFPNEKTYRHSLPEEAESIRTMLSVFESNKIPESKLSTSMRLLMELDKKGLLESWILLDNPDQGIAQDYVAYRKQHRDLLAKYIAEYDVHEN